MTSTTSGNGGPVVKKTRESRETAARVKLIRLVQGYATTQDFAAALKVKRQRLMNIENGYPLSIEVALRLVEVVPGLTLDWLFLGRESGLTVDLARRINNQAVIIGKG